MAEAEDDMLLVVALDFIVDKALLIDVVEVVGITGMVEVAGIVLVVEAVIAILLGLDDVPEV